MESEEVFDVCFLDIAMDKLSGIEAAKEIRKQQEQREKSIIIFATGYREYMEKSFRL